MFACEELRPMPSAAIFADTGAEPAAVYRWLDWLENRLPFPVHRVMRDQGLLRHIEDSAQFGTRYAGPPFFTDTGPGRAPGRLRRACTSEFKIEPITKKLRELVGLRPRQRAPRGSLLAIQCLGISTDEAQRVKPARQPWIKTRWPLIEARMSRDECLAWMRRHGFPEPPRSACVFCPYRSAGEWLDIRQTPEDWSIAVQIDAAIRSGVRGTKFPLYSHRSLRPLDLAVAANAEGDEERELPWQECEGMCGL